MISSLTRICPWAAGELGVNIADAIGVRFRLDAEQTVLDLLAFLQGLDGPPAQLVHRDRVTGHRVEPRRACRHGGEPDQLALEIDHRAAAHSQVQLGVELKSVG